MYGGSFEEQSNRADWDGAFQLWDDNANEFIEIAGCSITMTVADESGYEAFLGSTDAGSVIIESEGVFRWRFPAMSMTAYQPGTYKVGIRISRDGVTRQLFLGKLPIVEGVDRQ